MSKGKYWSQVEERLLSQLIQEGCKKAEIGRILGRSESSVINKCYRLKVPKPRKMSGKTATEALRMYREGHCMAEIARAAGVGTQTVKSFLISNGYQPKPRKGIKWGDDMQKRLEAMIIAGYDLTPIAANLGVSEQAVRGRIYITMGTASVRKAREYLLLDLEE